MKIVRKFISHLILFQAQKTFGNSYLKIYNSKNYDYFNVQIIIMYFVYMFGVMLIFYI
jgi:hypothetical protein